jgi:hypothetical protein
MIRSHNVGFHGFESDTEAGARDRPRILNRPQLKIGKPLSAAFIFSSLDAILRIPRLGADTKMHTIQRNGLNTKLPTSIVEGRFLATPNLFFPC